MKKNLEQLLTVSVPLDIQVNNMPMVALVDPVYSCLIRLAKPDALLNEEEVRKRGVI